MERARAYITVPRAPGHIRAIARPNVGTCCLLRRFVLTAASKRNGGGATAYAQHTVIAGLSFKLAPTRHTTQLRISYLILARRYSSPQRLVHLFARRCYITETVRHHMPYMSRSGLSPWLGVFPAAAVCDPYSKRAACAVVPFCSLGLDVWTMSIAALCCDCAAACLRCMAIVNLSREMFAPS